MTLQRKNPFRGPFSYQEADENNFFGRDMEVEELIKLIKNNRLTLLYGASGTGKTSLIKAKLLPHLKREYFHPIYIRINFANKNEDPLHSIQNRIVDELRLWDEHLPKFEPTQSLIDYASKNAIFNGLIKPVLFFDQFEELFTLGPAIDPFDIHCLMLQLSNLIELRLPDDLKTSDYINNISSFKVVFSLRQEYVGFLDDFNQMIPSINGARFRLKKFSPSQAMEAILLSSQNSISTETVEEIISTIGTPALWKQGIMSYDYIDKNLINREIDPFVLSLYCFQLYNKCIQFGYFQITTKFVLEHNDEELIRNYYEEKIIHYNDLKHLIEVKLLDESGIRLISPLNTFVSGEKRLEEMAYNLSIETGIVRIIGEGKESKIEIVHDRLALEIFNSKNENINKEANEKKREADNLNELARKAKKITFRVSIVSAIIIFILTGVSIYLYIYSVNNNTIGGLQDQLLQQKRLNENSQDSIKKLNWQVENSSTQMPRISDSINGLSGHTLRKFNEMLKFKNDSMLTLTGKIALLNNIITEKEEKNEMLNIDVRVARALISNANNQPDSPPIDASNEGPHSFEKTDFSKLKILNLKNPDGTFDFDDIKKNGFIFTFDVAENYGTDKGKIEIRVFPKRKNNQDNSFENEFDFIPNLQAMGQPRIVIKAPKDFKPGKASYDVKYFVDRGDSKTTYLLAKNIILISKPSQENNNP